MKDFDRAFQMTAQINRAIKQQTRAHSPAATTSPVFIAQFSRPKYVGIDFGIRKWTKVFDENFSSLRNFKLYNFIERKSCILKFVIS